MIVLTLSLTDSFVQQYRKFGQANYIFSYIKGEIQTVVSGNIQEQTDFVRGCDLFYTFVYLRNSAADCK